MAAPTPFNDFCAHNADRVIGRINIQFPMGNAAVHMPCPEQHGRSDPGTTFAIESVIHGNERG